MGKPLKPLVAESELVELDPVSETHTVVSVTFVSDAVPARLGEAVLRLMNEYMPEHVFGVTWSQYVLEDEDDSS